MAQKIASLYAEVGANTKPLEDGLNRTKQKLGETGKEAQKLGDRIGGFAKGFGKFALEAGVTSLGAAFVYATKQAAELQTTFGQIAALTNTPSTAIAGLRKEVLALSSDLPISANELAKGLYYISSSGFQGAEAMDILNTSAKAASAGLGETKTIADAVTSALNAYKLQGKDAARITDLLTYAVREGKGEPAELAGSLGRVLPVAAAAKVGMEDVSAAMAIMTRTGLSADEAATSLRGTISALLAPTKQAKDALAEIGLTTDDVSKMLAQPGGLVNVLKILMDRTGGNVEALDAIIPNIRALTGVLSLAGSQADDYAAALKGAYTATGLTDRAAAEMAKTMEFKLAKAKNSVENFGIAITTKLLPGLGDAAEAAGVLINWTDKLDAAFADSSDKITKNAKTYQEYRNNVLLAAIAAGKLSQAQLHAITTGEDANGQMLKSAQITDFLKDRVNLLSEEEFNAARAQEKLNDMAAFSATVHQASADAMNKNAEAAGYTAVETKKTREEAEKAAKAEQELAKALGEAKVSFEEYTAGFKDLSVESLLKLQIDQLKEAIKSTGDPTGVLTSKLHELEMQTGEITPQAEAARDAYGTLSQMFTKGYLTGEDLQRALGRLKTAAANGKVDVKELGLSASEASTYLYLMRDAANAAKESIDNIPRQVDVEVRFQTTGSAGRASGEITDIVPEATPAAHTSTPAATPSTGYAGGHEAARMVNGPQMNYGTTTTEAVGDKGGITIVNNITAPPNMNINELTTRVSQKIARSLRSAVSSGAGYAGG